MKRYAVRVFSAPFEVEVLAADPTAAGSLAIKLAAAAPASDTMLCEICELEESAPASSEAFSGGPEGSDTWAAPRSGERGC